MLTQNRNSYAENHDDNECKFPLQLTGGHQKMLKFRHCKDTMKLRRRRTKAYLRLRPTFGRTARSATLWYRHTQHVNESTIASELSRDGSQHLAESAVASEILGRAPAWRSHRCRRIGMSCAETQQRAQRHRIESLHKPSAHKPFQRQRFEAVPVGVRILVATLPRIPAIKVSLCMPVSTPDRDTSAAMTWIPVCLLLPTPPARPASTEGCGFALRCAAGPNSRTGTV